MTKSHEPFSYLHDHAVPEFSAGDKFTVMDAHCALCARGARWIVQHDTAREFRINPLQSDLGNALMRHYGVDPEYPNSWFYLESVRAYSSLFAFIRVGVRLGGIWKGLSALRIFPAPLQEILYRFVARNRCRFFGALELCTLPEREVQQRLFQ